MLDSPYRIYYNSANEQGRSSVLADERLFIFGGAEGGSGFMLREGEVRIPSGCAISGIISRSGGAVCGSDIVKSIAVMHDRSNGLGGGFAG